MGSRLAPRATNLCPRLRHDDGARGYRVAMLTGQARLGKVAAAHVTAQPKYCRFRGSAIAAPETSCMVDKHANKINESNLQLTPTIREVEYFEVEMTVRDDEIDEYGVVNNAIYASYIHSGRDVLLENLGISVDYWASTGNAMALSELNLKYFAPLRSGDRFVVKIRPMQIKGVRMLIHHLIETLPDRKLVLDAKGTIVFLNKGYRPTRVFPEVAAKAQAMFGCLNKS